MEKLHRRSHAKILLAASAAILAARSQGQVTTINLPPVNGFQPLVIFGVTDEQMDSDTADFPDIFFAQASSTPGGNGVPSQTLPVGGPQQFHVAIVDTGAQSNIFSYATASQLNLASANRLGGSSLKIIGASGSEFADITDTLGFYMASLDRGQNSGGSISVLPATTLKGMYNTSVLTTRAGSVLPDIVGSPVVGLYQTKILNSQPVHVTDGTKTYHSPKVEFVPQNTPISNDVYGSVELTTTNVVGGPPADFPSDFENFGNDPVQPTIWETLFADVTVAHTGGSRDRSFLFDTGAQVSVLSTATAAGIGIVTAGPNKTHVDFETDVVGVGGQTTKIPGYYINSLTLNSTAGDLSFTRVPVILLNLPDPRNPNQTLPGVLGTNLFAARDLIINIDTQGTGQTGLYVSAEQLAWKFNGNGSWSESAKWALALPSGIDTQANFFGAITNNATITVDSGGFTVGSIAFDNANRYTINGPGTISLQTSVEDAQMNVGSGSHTINAPVKLLSNTTIDVRAAASRLTVTSDVVATGVLITKIGPGTAEMKNLRAGSLSVNEGTLLVTSSGTNTGASKVSALTMGGGTILTGKLDLTNNAMVIDYDGASPAADLRGYLQSGLNGGAWTGNGVMSGTAAAITAGANIHKTGIGYAEQTALGGNPSTHFGQGVDATSILTRYTLFGDANLDGAVNGLDFTALAGSFDASNKFWWQGDFNYDGVVNALDFNAIATNWGSAIPAPLPGALVPEPGCAMLLAIFAPLAASRTRRAGSLDSRSRKRRTLTL